MRYFGTHHATGWSRTTHGTALRFYRPSGRRGLVALAGHFHMTYNPATMRYGCVPDVGDKWVIDPGDDLERRPDGKRAPRLQARLAQGRGDAQPAHTH